MLIFRTSADSRLAANSKVVRVRVLASKNKLAIVLPRNKGTFLADFAPIEEKDSAVSRISVSTWRLSPSTDKK